MAIRSKNRKLWQGIASVLFALCLSVGLHLWGIGQNGSFSTGVTEAVETTMVAETTYETIASTEASQATDPLEENPSGDESALEAARRNRMLSRFGAAGLLVAAIAFFAIYLALNRQEQPFLGPELEALLMMLLGYLILLLTGKLERNILLSGFAAAPFPVLLGNLLAWARHRFSLDWSGLHRLALLPGSFGWYVALMASGILVLLSGAGVLFLLKALLPGLWCLFAGGLALCCLIRLGVQVDRLRGQIYALHEGTPMEPRDSLFLRDEERLTELRQQRDEAVQKAVTGERFKVELISNVSHDLRTPLTAILGYGELLEGEPLTPEGLDRLHRLNQKAGYMRELVEELFELTKVSSGALEPHWEQIDLIRLLEQTVGLLDDRLTAQKLQVRRKYDAEAVLLTTDGTRMHRVFGNLLENAIKYALPGTRIYLETIDQGETVAVRMTNIASYEMDFQPEEIVQRFARGDKARTTRGSGLGLAIAQTYSESVGGSFRVEVDGDTFRAIVTLPK